MRFKILVLCLGSTLVGLVLQTLFFQESSSKLIYNQAKQESFRTLQNMQNDLQNISRSVENGLIDIYNEKEFVTDLKRGTDPGQMREKYYRAAYKLATENFDTSMAVLALYLYNAEHEIISTYRRAVTPKHNYPLDIYDTTQDNNAKRVKEYFESDETQMMISSYYNEYREKNIIRFVLKFYNYSSSDPRIGYAVCDVDSKVIEKIVRKYRRDEEMYIWLQPPGDRVMLQFGTLDESAQMIYEQISKKVSEGETELTGMQGGQREFFAVDQDKYRLSAYSLMPKSLLNKTQRVLNENLILITAVMLAAVSISVIFVSRTITRPLENMTDTVKRIQAGETQLRMENLNGDEVGNLSTSFNKMLDQIEGLIASQYENELTKNRAMYQALQAQINPHFLYNTLDTMSSIAEIQECTQVSALSQSLAGIFRYSLNMKEPLSTVAQEIIHLKNYIYVMDVRMQNQIGYVFDVEERVWQYTLPRISIQPLVENAINHGLRNKKGEKRICISAGEKDGCLQISVEDNGVGMTRQRIAEVLEGSGEVSEATSTSIGIINIHRRMKLLYGEEYGVVIHSEPGKGTMLFLRIPLDKQEEQKIWD
ncbi:MAG: sensor histidine kinase [Blautia sp.]|nr:sensor histidine kinase [Blautia sp.]